MGAFELELKLDRLSARLATELPPHLAAAARAYAAGSPPPPAPAFAPTEIAALRAARDEPSLSARATSLLRVVVPTAIEASRAVVAARAAERTWRAWHALRAARDAAAHALFGHPYLPLMHDLAGLDVPPDPALAPVDPGPPEPRWTTPSGHALTDADVHAAWAALATPAHGQLTIARSTSAHPRLFAVERGARATLVIPAAVASPATRFAVLHELGHALLWLSPQARDREWPRVLDEACAAYVTRATERPISVRCELGAAEERARRTQVARMLAACEAHGTEVGARPPWALWHDPAMQAAYVRAEAIADALPANLDGAALVAALAARC